MAAKLPDGGRQPHGQIGAIPLKGANGENAERAESCDPALSAMIRGKMMSDFEISVAERLPQP